MAAHSNGQRYQVHCSAVITQELKKLQSQAIKQGKSIASAFRQIIQCLRDNPTETGEPNYRLPFMQMQIRTVVVRPLVVDFAVCEDKPLVFIKGYAVNPTFLKQQLPNLPLPRPIPALPRPRILRASGTP